MSFPGNYNFNYYRGDTLEFLVYPKRADGQPFDLEDFFVAFTVSTSRGPAGEANRRPAYAQKSADNTHIVCAIRPSDSESWVEANSYVYDVEISNSAASPYPLVYTVLTGNISVTEQITEVQV